MAGGNNALVALFVNLEGRFARFDSAMQQAASKFDRFSNKMAKIGKTLTTRVSIPFGLIAREAYRATKEIDEALDSIAIATGKAGDALAGLEKDFKTTFTGNAASSAKDTATAIGQLNTRLGLTGEPLQKLAEKLLVVSRLTGTDVAGNVKTSTQLFQQWSVATEGQVDALNMVFSASQKTGVPFNTLLSQLTQFGPALQTAGFSLTQAAALFGQFEKAGVDTGTVMAGLQKTLRKLADGGVKDIPGALQAMIKDIKGAKTSQEALALSNLAFGKSSVAITKAIRSNQFDFAELAKQLGVSGDSIEDTRKKTDGLGEQLTQIGNKFKIAAGPIEGALSEALTNLEPLFEILSKGLGLISDAFADLSPNIKSAIVFFGGLIALAGPASYLVSGLGAGISLLTKTFGLFGGVIGALFTPIGALTIALGYCLVLISTPEFKRGIEILQAKFNELYQSFQTGAIIIANAIAQWKSEFTTGLQICSDFASKVKTILVEIKDSIVDVFTFNFLDDFKRGLDKIYDGYADLKTRLLDNSPLPEIQEGIEDTFEDGGESAVQSTVDTTGKIFDQWNIFQKKHKGQLGEIEKDQKALAKGIETIGADIEKTITDGATADLDDLTKQLRDGIIKKDIPALKALLNQTAKNKEGLKKFAAAWDTAEEAAAEAKRQHEEIERVFTDLERTAADLRGEITPMAKEFKKLLEAGNIEGAKKLATGLLKTGEKAADVTRAVQDATKAIDNEKRAIEEMRDLALDASRKMVDSFSKLAVAFGAPEDGVSAIATSLQDVIDLVEEIKDGTASSSFTDVFMNLGKLFSGDIDTSGFQGLARGLASIASAAADVIKPFAEMGKDGGANDLQQGVQGSLAAIGATIGAVYGGPTGSAVGASLGNTLGALIPGLVDSDPQDHIDRKTVEQWIEDALAGSRNKFFNAGGQLEEFNNNILRGGEGDFTDGAWAESFNQLDASAQMVFKGLGEGFKGLLGITEDVGGQIAFILANTFAGSVDNARLLVQQLGLDFDQLSEALLKSAVKGQITWHEYAVELQGLAQAFEPGRAAVADMTGSVDALIGSGGRGLIAIKSLRDLSIEATEAGVKDLAGLRQKLTESGKYTVKQIDQIFSALQQGGITNLDQLKDAGDDTLGLIVANLQSIGFEFKNTEQSIGEMNEGLDESQQKIDGILSTFDEFPAEVKTTVIIEEKHVSSGESSSSSSEDSESTAAASGGKSAILSRTVAKEVAKKITTTTRKKSSSSGKGSSGKAKKLSEEERKKAQDIARVVVDEFNAATGKKISFGEGEAFDLEGYNSYFETFNQQFDGLSQSAQNMARSIGSAIGSAKELSQGAITNLTAFLGSDFAGNIDKARHFVGLLKYDFEELAEGLVRLADQGDITWGEFATQVETIKEAFKPGLQANAAFGAAVDNFWGSGGKGFDAIQSIRDLGIEAMEAQIQSVDQLKKKLLEAGKPAEQLEALFASIAKQGITTTDELSRLNDLGAGLVAGGAANLGFKFATAAPLPSAGAVAADPEEERLRKRIEDAPSSYHRKQREKMLADYLAERKASKGFAHGGIFNRPTSMDLGTHIGRFAEFGSEIALRAKKIGGDYGLVGRVELGKNGAGGSPTYVVNAPNAAPGEADRIEAMLRRFHREVVNSAAATVADRARRGGGFSNAFRGGT